MLSIFTARTGPPTSGTGPAGLVVVEGELVALLLDVDGVGRGDFAPPEHAPTDDSSSRDAANGRT
ncbi:hypothetical protein GCM10027517_00290 [Phycicoccus ginsengisoli]